ncbi:MAG: type II toxin-antitoxin system RelE/ParE family toxin [Desulfobulbaceae bacterium]|nr:type II toxin-antitoxin system RelE/ParE family toxin [Desulfobulbaceae bacterium]
MSFRLTSKAADDIVAIFQDGARLFGGEQAERYHLGLAQVFALLAENPEMARERKEITPPVRIHPYGAHLIVYLVEQNRDVLIVRVRHGHEEWRENPL